MQTSEILKMHIAWKDYLAKQEPDKRLRFEQVMSAVNFLTAIGTQLRNLDAIGEPDKRRAQMTIIAEMAYGFACRLDAIGELACAADCLKPGWSRDDALDYLVAAHAAFVKHGFDIEHGDIKARYNSVAAVRKLVLDERKQEQERKENGK